MQNDKLLGSILNYITADVITAQITQCTEKWREYNYTPSYSKMYYILKGEGRVVINGNEYFPKPGQMCILPANIEQSYETISENHYLKYWTHFIFESGGNSIFDIIDVPYVIDIETTSVHRRVKEIFTNMIKNSEQKSFTSNLMLESYIRELVAIYFDTAGIENIQVKNSKESKRQRKILRYIEENIGEKISVEKMAKEVFLHPNYFIKYFKKTFGISPAKYINRKKIELACRLLSNQEPSVSEVSAELGFSDIYSFSKAFKRHTGFSPRYYKNYIASGKK